MSNLTTLTLWVVLGLTNRWIYGMNMLKRVSKEENKLTIEVNNQIVIDYRS